MAFATAAELATRLGVDLTAGEITDAGALLTRASSLIQGEVAQVIELVTNDALTRRGTWDTRLRLPERPVVDATAVTLDAVAVPAGEWYLEGDELVRSLAWGGPEAELVITYSHGYAVVPEAARAVCLEAVVRVWVNPGNVQQEGYGSEQVSYPARYTNRGSEVGGLLILRAEADMLRKKFGRPAGSTILR